MVCAAPKLSAIIVCHSFHGDKTVLFVQLTQFTEKCCPNAIELRHPPPGGTPRVVTSRSDTAPSAITPSKLVTRRSLVTKTTKHNRDNKTKVKNNSGRAKETSSAPTARIARR